MNRRRADKNLFEEELIEHVKNKPAIWKKSDPHHTNAVVVSNSWTAICDQLQPSCFITDGVSCAEHWKKLRSQWLAYKRKIKGKTGKAGGRQPFFRHALSMRYFDDSVEIENLAGEIYSNVQPDEDEIDDILQDRNDNDNDNDILDDNGHGSESPAAATSERRKSPPNTPTPKPSNKKQKLDPFGEQLLEVVRGKDLTEFQHFCSCVAIKIEKIANVNPAAAVRLQNEISTLVGNVEVDVLYS